MKHLEDDLQAACVKWFRYQYPNVVMFAIPNGGKRNAREAARMKATGTLPGVADLFVMKPRRYKMKITDSEGRSEVVDGLDYQCLGLFIELKTGKNGQTQAQKDFEEKAKIAGYAYRVCRSFDEFQKTVNDYLI